MGDFNGNNLDMEEGCMAFQAPATTTHTHPLCRTSHFCPQQTRTLERSPSQTPDRLHVDERRSLPSRESSRRHREIHPRQYRSPSPRTLHGQHKLVHLVPSRVLGVPKTLHCRQLQETIETTREMLLCQWLVHSRDQRTHTSQGSTAQAPVRSLMDERRSRSPREPFRLHQDEVRYRQPREHNQTSRETLRCQAQLVLSQRPLEEILRRSSTRPSRVFLPVVSHVKMTDRIIVLHVFPFSPIASKWPLNLACHPTLFVSLAISQ